MARPKSEQPKAQAEEPPVEKTSAVRFTTYLEPALIELLKDVAYEDRITLNSLVRDALEAHVAKLVKKRGEPYPKRRGELRRGKIT